MMPHSTAALVIEHDAYARLRLAEVLEQDGFVVAAASNGFSGVRLAAERQPQVVLLNLALPDLSGTEVAHELRRAAAAHTPAVIAMTATPHLLSEAERAEMDDCISATIGVPTLLATVHRAVQHASSRRTEHSSTRHAPAGHARPTPRNHVRG
jgi:DNA-binding response OmpR family regulator